MSKNTDVERLNALLEDAEDVLFHLDLGVTAKIEVELDGKTLTIGFEKRGKDWGISTMYLGNKAPLKGASLAVRVAVAKNLDALERAMRDAHDARLHDIELACSFAESFLARMGKGESTHDEDGQQE
jgi:hypothetical protein